MSTITDILGSDNITGSNDTINTNFDNLNTDKLEQSDIADFETSTQLDARDTANRERANHTGTQSADTIVDGAANKVFTDADNTKLDGIEDGAEANNISDSNAEDLTDGEDSILHFHNSDRDRTNHTGTQEASTVTNIANTITDSTDVGVQITDLAASIYDQMDTGFVAWTGTGDYWSTDDILGTFTLIRGGNGRIDGKNVDFIGDVAGSQTVSIPAGTTQEIYIDGNGSLQITTDDDTVLIPLFKAWRCADGVSIKPVKENHPYSFDSQVSTTWHRTIGTVFTTDSIGSIVFDAVTSGDGTLATDREVQVIGNGTVEDHGLITDILDSGGAGLSQSYVYLNVGGKWECQSSGTEFPMVYNLAGTPTAIPSGKFGIFKGYVSKDNLNTTDPVTFGFMSTDFYATSGAAETAITSDLLGINTAIVSPTAELAELELTRLGYAIVQNNVNGGFIVEIITNLQVVGGGNASVTGGDANSTSVDVSGFDNNLSSSDTNVQIALDTIDDLIIGKVDTASNVGIGEGEIVKGITGQDLQIKTLLAGTGVTITNGTDEIQIDATGAGGGEANTSIDGGTGGIGINLTKSGVTLPKKNLAANSNKISVTDDIPNNNIVFDVIETNIDHQNLNGAGTNTHAQIDTHIDSILNPHSVTQTQVGLGNVVNADTTTTANITDSTDKRFVTDAESTVIGNTSGTNTGDQTTVTGKSGSTDALNSATTTVNVSSATAPTVGQVLTAVDDSNATWQTPAGGGGGFSEEARVTKSGNQTITSGATTVVSFDVETYDIGNNYSGGVYTVPNTGTYLITAKIQVSPATIANGGEIRIKKMGTIIIRSSAVFAASGIQNINVSEHVKLTAGDTITMDIFQNSGGNVDIISGDDRTVFTFGQLN